jgi:adenosyl cobinamide kinase/adenosyl cobinamide phosphate guanylyltransferase
MVTEYTLCAFASAYIMSTPVGTGVIRKLAPTRMFLRLLGAIHHVLCDSYDTVDVCFADAVYDSIFSCHLLSP